MSDSCLFLDTMLGNILRMMPRNILKIMLEDQDHVQHYVRDNSEGDV